MTTSLSSETVRRLRAQRDEYARALNLQPVPDLSSGGIPMAASTSNAPFTTHYPTLPTTASRRRPSLISEYSATHSVHRAPSSPSGTSRPLVSPNAPSRPSLNTSLDLSPATSKSASNERDNFEPIVGPLQLQTYLHYVWFGCLLLLAITSFAPSGLPWIPHQSYANVGIYFAACSIVVLISRLLRRGRSLIQFYLNNIVLYIFVLVSREQHVLFSLLWYVSITVINMQSSAAKMHTHILAPTAIYLVVYTIAILTMRYGFTNTVGAKYSAFLPLESDVTCQSDIGCIWREEVIFFIAIFLLQIGLWLLQRFIHRYASYLTDRRRKMDKLTTANQQLRDKISTLKQDVNLDLDSPLTKVIKIIREIQERNKGNEEMHESLGYAVSILSSNHLFSINLSAQIEGMDQDVKSWLDGLLTTQDAHPVETTFTGLTPASGQMRTVNRDNDSQTLSGLQRRVAEESLSASRKGISGIARVNHTRIVECLKKTNEWSFDCFELAEITEGRPLFYLGYHLFEEHDFKNLFHIDDDRLLKFLSKLEDGYRKNPYHNSIHASDVAQTIEYFLTVLGLNQILTAEERLACILAACIHDVDHPGLNNPFMIDTRNELALRYNDTAVLENHHCAKAFEWLLFDPECNILANIKPVSTRRTIRQCIVKMVLATDLTGHYEYISRLKNKLTTNTLDLKDAKDRQLLMDMAIKCSDISNPAKDASFAQKWTDLVFAEYFTQGDQERIRNMPISTFMDRNLVSVSKCQLGFIDFLVFPLFEVWEEYIHKYGDYPAMDNIAKNRDFWKTFNDPPPGPVTMLSISPIPTPKYIIPYLTTPPDLHFIPPLFRNIPSVIGTSGADNVTIHISNSTQESSRIIDASQGTQPNNHNAYPSRTSDVTQTLPNHTTHSSLRLPTISGSATSSSRLLPLQKQD